LLSAVTSIRRATPSTRIVRLDLQGHPFSFAAGQAALLGVPGAPERVPYSIACAPEDLAKDGRLEFLIKLEGGHWGGHLAGLKRGSDVEIEGPKGRFTFPSNPAEQHFLFVAGGTGISPLRSMIRHAIQGQIPGRLHLLYSARTPSDFAYLPELRALARQGKLALSLTATREVRPRWRGDRARITLDKLRPLVERPETLCFVCGPRTMVDDVPRMLQELEVDASRIRIEDW
jgi:NAD(P)H-flavin reductase